MARVSSLLILLAVQAAGALGGFPPPQRLDDGILLEVGDRWLRLQVCRERVFRVLYAAEPDFFERDTLMTDSQPCQPTPWELDARADSVELSSPSLTVRVGLADGRITFLDADGQLLLEEKREGGKTLTPAEVQGEHVFHLRTEFEPQDGEQFYGLGQHQNGSMGYRGEVVDLYQSNTVAAIPFLVSSRGYGILWDNTSQTRFGDLNPPRPIPAARLFNSEGRPGGLTGTYHQGDCNGPVVATRTDSTIDLGAPEDRPPVSAIHQAPQASNTDVHPQLQAGDICVVWQGELETDTGGMYELVSFSNNDLHLWFDNELVVDTWRQGWLAWKDVVRRSLAAETRYPIRIEWRKNQGEGTLRLEWKTPPSYTYTSLWSEVGDGIDYYFVYGPKLDDVVAGYREITGGAPLMPRWAFGLWQSRERYETAEQSLGVLAEFRRRHIPIDTIVQDWQYWVDDRWGSHEFDPSRFPDPEGWIAEIHDRYHARLMISVWPKFYTGTKNFEALATAGFLYPETLRRPTTDWLGHVHTFYDAFNPAARQLFWEQMNRELFSKGVDAWWMDATEPELVGEGTAAALKATMNPTALGTGARMANAFALVSSQAVYEGQRQVRPDQRVFILTRSAFAGIQRYASATWSGDVSADWSSFAKQIPAGLNFSLSGVPYWTTDVGGFAVPPRWSTETPLPADVEEWRELVTRWFQFATFCPLLRVHGQFPPREMWFFGGEEHPAYRTQLAFDRLRYRLLPYIYSLAANVTFNHGTLMRPLVMDFPDDPRALEIADQFLFGPALLVNPVTRPGASSRPVYLPGGVDWFDFWTGVRYRGGTVVQAAAPYESMPVYVRAGSIVPVGPDLEYTDQKPSDPITLWVYQGADGQFEIYEDDGVSYDYEKGACARIPIRWNDAAQTLTIGRRSGSFPAMLGQRTFQVVFVSGDRPAGYTAEPSEPLSVHYTGEAVVLAANAARKASDSDPSEPTR